MLCKGLRTLKELDIEKRTRKCVVSISPTQPPRGVGWGRFLQTGDFLQTAVKGLSSPSHQGVGVLGSGRKPGCFLQTVGCGCSSNCITRTGAENANYGPYYFSLQGLGSGVRFPCRPSLGSIGLESKSLASILFHVLEPYLLRLLWFLPGLLPPRPPFSVLTQCDLFHSHSATGDSCLLS